MVQIRRTAEEAGESLAELIVAIAIIGIAVVGIIGAVGTAATTSTLNREQGTAGNVLRSYAEYVQALPFQCDANYPSMEFDDEARPSVSGSGHYVASVSAGAGCGSTRTQQFTIEVVSTGSVTTHPVQLSLDVVKRDPS